MNYKKESSKLEITGKTVRQPIVDADPTDNNVDLNETVIERDNNEDGNDNDSNNDRVHLVPRRETNREEVNRPNQVAGNAPEQDRIGQVDPDRPRTAAAQINEPRDVRIAQRNDRKTRSQGGAPEIENVLQNPIERSARLQNKFKEIHKLN